MQLVDEHIEHLLFSLENRDVGIFLLLDFLLQIEGQRLLIEFSEQSETLEVLISGRSILVNLVLDNARNDSDLLSVVLRSGHFCGEG